MAVVWLVLKIILLAILAVIALIILILCLPCYIYLSFEQELTADVRFLFIRFKVYPSDKDEPGIVEKLVLKFWRYLIGVSGKESDAQSISDIGDEAGFKELFEDRGASGAIAFLWQVLTVAFGRFVNILRGVVIKKFDLLVGITGDDPAEAAIRFGKLSGVLYTSLSFIFQNVKKYKHEGIDIHADYESPFDQVKLDSTLRIFPIVIVGHIIALLFDLIASETKRQVAENMARQNIKSVQGGRSK